MKRKTIPLNLVVLLLGQAVLADTVLPAAVTVSVSDNLPKLLKQADTDRDQKITVRDKSVQFKLTDKDKKSYTIQGTYALSVLLQELTLAKQRGEQVAQLERVKLQENIVDRTSRLIRELFWDGLTRSTDEKGLGEILKDSKTSTKNAKNYLYVPEADKIALKYFRDIAQKQPKLKLEVRPVPRDITASFFKSLDGHHGLLGLKVVSDPKSKSPRPLPYVVPGGRFNEMYGWDSYFINKGLLLDGKTELAKAMVDNQAYQIEHYGKILNANRTYYLTRSQPPFFTSMLRETYSQLPKTDETKAWLKQNLKWAIHEYKTIWSVEPRLIPTLQLSRYFDEGSGPGPEVEPGGYDALVAPFARAAKLSPREYLRRYQKGQIKNLELENLFKQDRTVRETGHDTTYRFDLRANDFATVDLNSLLYKYESDIAYLIETEFEGALDQEKPSAWKTLASKRKELINRYFWDEEKGFYFDYDFKNKSQSDYISATAFYPLWAGVSTAEQAKKVLAFSAKHLETLGGIAASAESSRGKISNPDRPQRQWDYPYGWPPHQIIAWEGLIKYGLEAPAQRLAYRWLYAMTKNARDFNGMVTEKYDVVTGSHEAFVEYGNVGSKFAYITREGFGWTNASYQVGLKLLTPEQLNSLKKLTTPESVF